MNRRRRFAFSSLFLLVVFVGVPLLLTWRAVRQERLDRALITAVKQRKADAVVSLLKQGADPNTREHSKGTVSIWQAIHNLFLRFRQKETSAPQEGDPALILAVEAYGYRGELPGNVDSHIVSALLDAGANPNGRDVDDHLTALESAVTDCPSQVQHLLDKGADVNAGGDNGITPLMSADDPAIVRLLLDRGADVNATDVTRTSSLIYQTRNSACDPQILGLLLDRGAEVNAKGVNGWTALMWTAANGDVTGVRLLLDRGADINAHNPNGQTALMLAVASDQTQTVKTLLARHVDTTVKDYNGRSALSYALKHNKRVVIRLLKQAGAKE